MTEPTLLDDYRAAKSAKPTIEDSHQADVVNPNIETVDDALRAFFTTTPSWLRKIMRLRNAIVGRLGFETGEAPESTLPDRFEIGHSISVFKVLDRSEDEILMGGDDGRFSMRISIQLLGNEAPRTVHLSTVAYNNDTLGKAYLSLVKFPHGPIAKMCTKRIATVTPSVDPARDNN